VTALCGSPPAATCFGRPPSAPHSAGSEIAQGYKPQPKVYLATCEAFNLEPAQVMMCAAHSGDLAAAQALGLKTGHIGRPGEGGPGTGETEPKGSFDVVGKNFHDFADKLGV
jgi:2-haloacid dehalogenase